MVSNSNPKRDSAGEGTHALDAGGLPGPLTPFTCPDCGGTLWELREGDMVRFQCHVGHRFTAGRMLSAHSDALESALWTALRTLEENAALWNRMADRRTVAA